MSEITDSVEVNITTDDTSITRTGFALPIILSGSAWLSSERTREYSKLSEAQADGFGPTTPEYQALAKIFGQTPRVKSCLIGKLRLPPTQRFAITPTAINSHTYKLTVNGTEVSYTSDANATVAEIIAGLKTAIDALALGLTTSDQTTYLRALAGTPGAWFSIGSVDSALIVKQDHADPGAATDLAEIALERNDWFWVQSNFNSQAYAAAIAAWCEANDKFFPVQSDDGAIPNTTLSGTDDLGEQLRSLAYEHSATIYGKSAGDQVDAGLIGRLAPLDPGTYVAKFKTLAGVPVGSYTQTQRTNMRNKRVNFYETTAGKGSFEEGYTPSGLWIDYVVFRSWLSAQLRENVYAILVASDKVPQNDRGIEMIATAVRATLQNAADNEKILQTFELVIPKIGDIAPSDREARILNSIDWTATYSAGWQHIIMNGRINF